MNHNDVICWEKRVSLLNDGAFLLQLWGIVVEPGVGMLELKKKSISAIAAKLRFYPWKAKTKTKLWIYLESSRVFFSVGSKSFRGLLTTRKIITFRGKFFLRALWGATTEQEKPFQEKHFFFSFYALELSHVRIPRSKVSRSTRRERERDLLAASLFRAWVYARPLAMPSVRPDCYSRYHFVTDLSFFTLDGLTIDSIKREAIAQLRCKLELEIKDDWCLFSFDVYVVFVIDIAIKVRSNWVNIGQS